MPHAWYRSPSVLIVPALVGMVWLVYSSREAVTFVLDDAHNDFENVAIRLEALSPGRLIRPMSELPTPNRPLPFLSFAVDWLREGGQPDVFYRTNVWIRAAVALLVQAFFARILAAPGVARARLHLSAALAAAAWAVHPIQVSAVAYLVQRMAELAALFSVGPSSPTSRRAAEERRGGGYAGLRHARCRWPWAC